MPNPDVELGGSSLDSGYQSNRNQSLPDFSPNLSASGSPYYSKATARTSAVEAPHHRAVVKTKSKSFNGRRLGQRKLLFQKRKWVSDTAFVLAIVGILLMMFEAEMFAANVYEKGSRPSNSIKTIISLTTFLLEISIVTYHVLEIKLFLVDNFATDWRIAWTPARGLQLGVEMIICAVHPVPGRYYTFSWPEKLNSAFSNSHHLVPVDVILSILMFFRLYLIGRVILLRSTLFANASSRSIGALNQVTFNTSFAFKTLMTNCPGTILAIFVVSFWIMAAWTSRACERNEDVNHANFLNQLWLIAITFLTIGYGDVVPLTYCGRAVSVITGIVGVGCTSLVIAVIARQLEMTRAEKHVHNFMTNTLLTKRLQNAAANVIREAWFIHKYKTLDGQKHNSFCVRSHRRKFVRAVDVLRQVKVDQRKLLDDASNLAVVGQNQMQPYEVRADQTARLDALERHYGALEGRLELVRQSLLQFNENIAILSASLQCQQKRSMLLAGSKQRSTGDGDKMKIPWQVQKNVVLEQGNSTFVGDQRKSALLSKETKASLSFHRRRCYSEDSRGFYEYGIT